MDTKGLHLLRFNHAGSLVLNDGSTINYGVISIEHDQLLYYTGRGLRELWSPRMTPEQEERAVQLRELPPEQLIATGHVAVLDLADIQRVLY